MNSSISPGDSRLELYLQALTLVLLILLGLGLNLTVIVTYSSSRILRSQKHNVFIINLMVCDLVYVLWVMPVTAADVVCPLGVVCLPALREGVLCGMTGFLTVFQCSLASLTLAAIAADRYIAVLRPIQYTTVFTRARCLALLTACWLWACLTALPPLFPFETSATYYFEPGTKHCSPSFRTTCWYFWYAVTMGFGLPLPTMAFCYWKVARVLGQRKRKIFVLPWRMLVENSPKRRNTSENIHQRLGNQDATKLFCVSEVVMDTSKNDGLLKDTPVKKSTSNCVDKQIARRGGLLIAAYFLCWGPYAVTHACPVHVHVARSVEVVAMWLVFSLTVINPVIYVFNNRQFRAELKKCLGRSTGGVKVDVVCNR